MGTYYAYIRAVYVQRVPLEADNLDDAQKEADELAGEVCPGLDGECTDWDVESVSREDPDDDDGDPSIDCTDSYWADLAMADDHGKCCEVCGNFDEGKKECGLK